MVPLPSLPPVDFEGIIRPELVGVLQERSHQLRNRTVTQVLIQWQGEGTENATWENFVPAATTISSPSGQGVLI